MFLSLTVADPMSVHSWHSSWAPRIAELREGSREPTFSILGGLDLGGEAGGDDFQGL